MTTGLVGSEMCIRDSPNSLPTIPTTPTPHQQSPPPQLLINNPHHPNSSPTIPTPHQQSPPPQLLTNNPHHPNSSPTIPTTPTPHQQFPTLPPPHLWSCVAMSFSRDWGQSASVSCDSSTRWISMVSMKAASCSLPPPLPPPPAAPPSSSESSSASLPRPFFLVDFVLTSRPPVPSFLLPAGGIKRLCQYGVVTL